MSLLRTASKAEEASIGLRWQAKPHGEEVHAGRLTSGFQRHGDKAYSFFEVQRVQARVESHVTHRGGPWVDS